MGGNQPCRYERPWGKPARGNEPCTRARIQQSPPGPRIPTMRARRNAEPAETTENRWFLRALRSLRPVGGWSRRTNTLTGAANAIC